MFCIIKILYLYFNNMVMESKILGINFEIKNFIFNSN
jgi:hypothetical protein